MPRPHGRTDECTREEARARLRRAEEFLAVADLVLGEHTADGQDGLNLSGVAAALAVLAGIAAADAACCHRLGHRSRSQDHRDAITLVRPLAAHGDALANDLGRLLDLKDSAHYGILGVAHTEARRAVEWAHRLVEHTREVLATP